MSVQIARLVGAIADRNAPVKELMETIKAKEIERVALQDRVRLLGADNVAILHPTALVAFGKNVETLHAKLKKDPRDPECGLAFANVIDSVIVHPTAKAAPYEISLYARLTAITSVDLFPVRTSVEEVLAAEAFSRIGSDGDVSSRPPSSRCSTGSSSR